MRSAQVSSWRWLRLYLTTNAPGRGDDGAQEPVRVHMVVAKLREKAADPHARIVNGGVRSRRAGARCVRRNPDVDRLPGIHRQTDRQLATLALAGRGPSINGDRGQRSIERMPAAQNEIPGPGFTVRQPEAVSVEPHMNVAVINGSRQARARTDGPEVGPLESLIQAVQPLDEGFKGRVSVPEIAVMFNGQHRFSQEQVTGELRQIAGIAAP